MWMYSKPHVTVQSHTHTHTFTAQTSKPKNWIWLWIWEYSYKRIHSLSLLGNCSFLHLCYFVVVKLWRRCLLDAVRGTESKWNEFFINFWGICLSFWNFQRFCLDGIHFSSGSWHFTTVRFLDWDQMGGSRTLGRSSGYVGIEEAAVRVRMVVYRAADQPKPSTRWLMPFPAPSPWLRVLQNRKMLFGKTKHRKLSSTVPAGTHRQFDSGSALQPSKRWLLSDARIHTITSESIH